MWTQAFQAIFGPGTPGSWLIPSSNAHQSLSHAADGHSLGVSGEQPAPRLPPLKAPGLSQPCHLPVMIDPLALWPALALSPWGLEPTWAKAQALSLINPDGYRPCFQLWFEVRPSLA